jgi:hypothetical protein
VIGAAEARDAGIPRSTSSADEWGFAWVRRFATETGCAWMRPRAVTTKFEEMREAWFTVMALMWIAQMMAPSARRRREGYGQGKPTSALLAIYAYRRVMRDCARHLPDMSAARGALKGICNRYKLRWGDDAFIPSRKQPYSSEHMRAIASWLTARCNPLNWPAVLCRAVLTAFCYAISTGVRKDEWTCDDDTYVRRGNFAWVEEHTMSDLPNTPDVIASRRNGHLLRGRAAASKCDRLNIEWGSRDMWFRYDDTNPVNFAWRWQQWEIAYPCPPQERQRWPAFSPHGNHVPFTRTRADTCLHTMLPLIMGIAAAAKRSWRRAPQRARPAMAVFRQLPWMALDEHSPRVPPIPSGGLKANLQYMIQCYYNFSKANTEATITHLRNLRVTLPSLDFTL